MSDSLREGMQVGNAFAQFGANMRGIMDKNEVVQKKQAYDSEVHSHFKQLAQGREIDMTTVKDPKAYADAVRMADEHKKFQEARQKSAFIKTTGETVALLNKAGAAYKSGDEVTGNRTTLEIYDIIHDGVTVRKDDYGNYLIAGGKFSTVDAEGNVEDHPFTSDYLIGMTRQYITDDQGNIDLAKFNATLTGSWQNVVAINKQRWKHPRVYTDKDGKKGYEVTLLDQGSGLEQTVRADENKNVIDADTWIKRGFTSTEDKKATADLRGKMLTNEKTQAEIDAKANEPAEKAQKRYDDAYDTAGDAWDKLYTEYIKNGTGADGEGAGSRAAFEAENGTRENFIKKEMEAKGIEYKKPKPKSVALDIKAAKQILALTPERQAKFLDALSPEDKKLFEKFKGQIEGETKPTPEKKTPPAPKPEINPRPTKKEGEKSDTAGLSKVEFNKRAAAIAEENPELSKEDVAKMVRDDENARGEERASRRKANLTGIRKAMSGVAGRVRGAAPANKKPEGKQADIDYSAY
ncbi:MAG: hypothetical protein JW724_00375 [Candidatus Altiarchaeota archaeon]|nr:hypothetical protein [Candidatus Altiarchaeota archaeon]